MKPPTHPKAVPRRPEGQPTRGKTARNRLRRVDEFLVRYDPALLQREDGVYTGAAVVDLGFGAEPFTTLEMAVRLRRLNPELTVLGVEIDPERVEAAQPYADEKTRFRLGGFNLPLEQQADGTQEGARVVRAFNVLRQYDEAAVVDAYTRLSRCLLPGGLLVEGTSDPFGRLWTANVLRRPPAVDASCVFEALVFSTNFRLGFDPGDFQAVLPKNQIHRMTPGEPIHTFFEAWKGAARTAAAYRVWGPRQWFIASAQVLAETGWAVNTRRSWLSRGYLILNELAAGDQSCYHSADVDLHPHN